MEIDYQQFRDWHLGRCQDDSTAAEIERQLEDPDSYCSALMWLTRGDKSEIASEMLNATFASSVSTSTSTPTSEAEHPIAQGPAQFPALYSGIANQGDLAVQDRPEPDFITIASSPNPNSILASSVRALSSFLSHLKPRRLPLPYAIAMLVSGLANVFAVISIPTVNRQNSYTNAVFVLENPIEAVGTEPTGLMAGDLRGNGTLDLVVAYRVSEGAVGVLLKRGHNFAEVRRYKTGGSFPEHLAIGDLDDDGNLDILVANSNSATLGILWGNKNATFGNAQLIDTQSNNYNSTPFFPYIVDLNGDKKMDILLVDRGGGVVMARLNRGTRVFPDAIRSPIGGTYPNALAIADFDGDHIPDLAVVHEVKAGKLTIMKGKGNGSFLTTESYFTEGTEPSCVVACDFNGDGWVDLAFSNLNEGRIGVLINHDSGKFIPQVPYHTEGLFPSTMVTGDFNKDGKQDIAVTTSGSNSVEILKGKGDGTFAPGGAYYSGGTHPNGLAIGDFNGDGRLDLAVSNQNSASIAILRNEPTKD